MSATLSYQQLTDLIGPLVDHRDPVHLPQLISYMDQTCDAGAQNDISGVQTGFSGPPGSLGFIVCILTSVLLLDPQIRAASVLSCDLFICSHNNATRGRA